jgi:hypothetical protein
VVTPYTVREKANNERSGLAAPFTGNSKASEQNLLGGFDLLGLTGVAYLSDP